MNAIHRTVLRKSRPYMMENIHDVSEILDYLYADNILTSDMMEDIRETSTSRKRKELLLDLLPTRGPQGFECFLYALTQAGHSFVADELRQVESDEARIETLAVQEFVEVEDGVNDPQPESQNNERTRRETGDNEPMNIEQETTAHQFVANGNDEVDMTISFKPVQPDFYDSIKNESYKMEYPLTKMFRGRVVMLNNELFSDSRDNRVGSNVDKNNLCNLFCKLGFEVKVYENKTAQEMIDICKHEGDGHVSSAQPLSQSDVFVMCILSHGETNGRVRGTDGGLVEVQRIKNIFDGENCPSLLGKPKLFIIQACQGCKETTGVLCSEDGTVRGFQGVEFGSATPQTVPDVIAERRVHERADILESRATVNNYAAYRNKIYGSWFIRSIVEVFTANAHKDDVLSMLTKVADIVKDKKTEDSGCVQISEVTTTLTKKLFLLPPN